MSVSDLFERLEVLASTGSPLDLTQIRKDIHAEHERATSAADRVALLTIHKLVMDQAEREIGAEELEKFRRIRNQDYSLLLVQEAMIGNSSGNIDPKRIAAITRREVQAGRMSPDDQLHKIALAGERIRSRAPTKPGLLTRLKDLFSRRMRL